MFSVDLARESYWGKKKDISFMPLPSVTGSPANDLEQVGIPISKECALQPVILHLSYFDEDI